MYIIHNDEKVINLAKKWCLEDAIGTDSAELIAKVILSKYNSKSFPCTINLQRLIGTLDSKRLQLAIGVILYSDDSIGTWAEMEQLKDLYLN